MSGVAWQLVEPVLVAMVVAACALYAVHRLWPAACRRARVALALALLRGARSDALRHLATVVAPPRSVTHVGNASCGPCRGCDKSR